MSDIAKSGASVAHGNVRRLAHPALNMAYEPLPEPESARAIVLGVYCY